MYAVTPSNISHNLPTILDTYVVSFCTEIGELQMVIAGAATGMIWIQEGLSPPENVPLQPGLVPIRRNSREGCFAPQGSK